MQFLGIGLIYGLRFYSNGILSTEEVVKYVQTNALLYEYYRQAKEMIPTDTGKVLLKLFSGDDFKIVESRCKKVNFYSCDGVSPDSKFRMKDYFWFNH